MGKGSEQISKRYSVVVTNIFKERFEFSVTTRLGEYKAAVLAAQRFAAENVNEKGILYDVDVSFIGNVEVVPITSGPSAGRFSEVIPEDDVTDAMEW